MNHRGHQPAGVPVPGSLHLTAQMGGVEAQCPVGDQELADLVVVGWGLGGCRLLVVHFQSRLGQVVYLAIARIRGRHGTMHKK